MKFTSFRSSQPSPVCTSPYLLMSPSLGKHSRLQRRFLHPIPSSTWTDHRQGNASHCPSHPHHLGQPTGADFPLSYPFIHCSALPPSPQLWAQVSSRLDLSKVPEHDHDLAEVFSKRHALSLSLRTAPTIVQSTCCLAFPTAASSTCLARRGR